uniref:ATP synthase F0 subunit 8 n=1 Tax=Pheretima okutamaensis TaxID=2973154 RepID=A0AA48GH69_9ANNE|nr:ATP synthase F0 subunit 8 [Pheretima okutamaensis]
MPHLSPMSWLLAILAFWTIIMLFISNIWWISTHTFETGTMQTSSNKHSIWHWS